MANEANYKLDIRNGVLLSCNVIDTKNGKVVTVPDGVTAIGERAFWHCIEIHGIVLPDSVRRIGAEAFGLCCGLRWIKLPPVVDEDFAPSSVFYGCDRLEEVVYPEGLKGAGSFGGYDGYPFNLKRMVLPRSLTSFCYRAEVGLSSFAVIVYKGTRKKWEGIVSKYSKHTCPVICTELDGTEEKTPLERFIIEDGVLEGFKKKYSRRDRKDGEDSTVWIPDGVKTVADFGPTNLGIYRIILSEGVSCVKKNAFRRLDNLEELFLPSTLTEIEEDPTWLCPRLRQVTYNGTKEMWRKLDEVTSPFSHSVKIICTDGEYERTAK
ncbi:MAG: leucine-rich repeat protein [Clostridia bacterium]|nr:leucine-rich repeat protein [Clostridia bacterium]